MWQWGVVALMVAAMPGGDETESAADRARSALAERLQVPTEAVEVLETEPAEWPSAALGCPQKGHVYAQVLTSGYRVRLGHDGRERWAHVSGKQVVFCDAAPRASKNAALFQTVARVSAEARRDLAERLGIEETAVKVVRVRPRPSASDLEGCPPAVEPGPTGGGTLLLVLRAQEAEHRYRADGGRLGYCGTP